MPIKGWKKVSETEWQGKDGGSVWITRRYPSYFWSGSGYKGWFVLTHGILLAPKTPDTPRAWSNELTRVEAVKIAAKYMRDHPGGR